uniref:Fe2OG dioxygenase domain-containing protein n=1 Tax=Spumella elongata TaxID=89044 RepID=A0A7S3HD96_9STRA
MDMHTDDSDVTFNLCLGLEFTSAGLQFCGHMGAPNHRKHTLTYQHVKGSCVVHLGRKRHGADDISSGERLNLILWNHSSAYRQSDECTDPEYVAEEGPPDSVCVSYTHDRDYGHFKDYPKGKEHFRGRGWCPRRSFEYAEFKPDCDKEQPPV